MDERLSIPLEISNRLSCCLVDANEDCGGTGSVVIIDLDLKTIIQLKCAIFKCCAQCAPIVKSKIMSILAVVVEVKDPKRIKVS